MTESAVAEMHLAELDRHPPTARLLAAHAALPVAVDPELLRHLRDNFLLDGPLRLPVTPDSEAVLARLLLSAVFTQVDDDLFEMNRPVRAVLLSELQGIDGGRRIGEVAALLERYTLGHTTWSEELRWAQRISARVTHDPQAMQDWLAAGARQDGGVGLGGRWFAAMRTRIEQDRTATAMLSSLRGAAVPAGASVFVSRRRGDADWVADAVADALTLRLGRDRVFLDDRSLEPGSDVESTLLGALRRSGVVVVIIGPGWDEPAMLRRLEGDNDWVRREIVAAHARGVRVLPVLVDRPAVEVSRLADELRFLADAVPSRVRRDHAAEDVQHLVDTIIDLLAGGRATATAGGPDTTLTRAAVDALLREILPGAQQVSGNRARLVELTLTLLGAGERLVYLALSRYPGQPNGSMTVLVTDADVIAVEIDEGFRMVSSERFARSSIEAVTLQTHLRLGLRTGDLELHLAGRPVVRWMGLFLDQAETLAGLLKPRRLTSTVAGVPAELIGFARDLESVNDLPEFRQRVAARAPMLDELRALARTRAVAWRSVRSRLLDSASAGERLVGVVILQVDPDSAYLERLADKAAPGNDLDHIAYEAAVALRNAAEYLPPGHLNAVTAAVAAAVDALAGFRQSDRAAVLDRAAAILAERQTALTPPDRIRIPWRLWTDWPVLRVRFLDGTRHQHAAVRTLAGQWTDGTNLWFEFLPAGSTAPAEIRVTFALGTGDWSLLGTEALDADPDGPTMALDPELDRKKVLQLFGRALGLVPEHQQPNADLPWNRDTVVRALTGPPHHWTREQVEEHFFSRYELDSPPIYRPFDKRSVMLPEFDPTFFTGGFTTQANAYLSRSDKEFIARLYPSAEAMAAPRDDVEPSVHEQLGDARRAEGLAAAQEAVDLRREQAAGNRDAFLPDLAASVNNLAGWLGEAGRRAEALAAAQEAVDLYRELVARKPDAHRPDLAMALNNLGVRYSEAGRLQEALAPTEEAVTTYRGLVQAGKAAFLPDIAMALNNLGSYYGELGRRRDALVPTEEAVTTYRGLVQAGNPAFLPDLARALNNIGVRYSELGRREEALVPIEEAVTIYRGLVEAGNAAFLPDLASALSNLGIRYSELGRREEALVPIEEAVTIYRGLVEAGNAAFLPDLASALNNLGIRYSELGRREEALVPIEEAVTTYRGLVEAGNPAFRLNLASALNNVGASYSDLGRQEEALATAEEAVTIYRSLVEANPAAYLPDLARALTNLGASYRELSWPEEALATAEEAVTIYRGLVEAGNPVFLPDLAGGLNSLGICLGELDRREDALAPVKEAVTIYRGLVEAGNPVFLPDLARTLNNLGACYSELGRGREALAPTEEAVTAYRSLVEGNLAFLPQLAHALTNFGTCIGELGQRAEALASAEETVTIYRGLVEAGNPAFLPDLAAELNNLGIRYSELGRRAEALASTEEAVTTYRGLVEAGNPASLPNLAAALDNLGNRYREAGRPEKSDTAWTDAITNLPDAVRAVLLVLRSQYAPPGTIEAAPWLVRALPAADQDEGLLVALHDEARRHDDADPMTWRRAWQRAGGAPAPDWLTLDRSLLVAARAWLDTTSYTAERDHLAGHGDLLDETADAAVHEALLQVSPEEAARYADLREVARTKGVDAAYRPLMMQVLAAEFAGASLDRQRDLLDRRRADLLGDEIRATIAATAATDDAPAEYVQAHALLDIAAVSDAAALAAVFDAMADPGRFDALLTTTATRRGSAPELAALAQLARLYARDEREAGHALLFGAVAAADVGDGERARVLIDAAVEVAPDQRQAWSRLLLTIGSVRPVLDLVDGLVGESATDAAQE